MNFNNCPLCQAPLYKCRPAFDTESYPDWREYKCTKCKVLGMDEHSAFKVDYNDGYFQFIESISITVHNLKLYIDYNKDKMTVFSVREIPDYSKYASDDALYHAVHNITRPTYDRVLEMKAPPLDFSKPIDKDQLYNKIRMWITFS